MAYVHIGTHKTGTTSIQAFLGANEAAFAESGIVLPKTGRSDPRFASQPNIAWELLDDPRFDTRGGTFDELLAEIAASKSPKACISAEDLDTLHLYPGALERLACGFRSIGYEPRAVVYLRPQVDYCESLYAELARGGWRIALSEILDDVSSQTPSYAARFDYDLMLRCFAAAFGGDRLMIVRAYDATAADEWLLRDFTTIVGGASLNRRFGAFASPKRLNERPTFGAVYAAIAGVFGLADELDDDAAASGAFEPLTLRDVVALLARFRAGNERIASRYGVRIQGISRGRLARLLGDILGINGVSRRQKTWFRHVRDGATPCLGSGMEPFEVGGREREGLANMLAD